MLKSRKFFVGLLLAIMIVSVGAVIGFCFISTSISAIASLLVVSIGAIYQFCEFKRGKMVIDTIAVIFMGTLIGSLMILPVWGYIISFFAGAIGLFLLLYGYTGRKKEEE